MGIQQWIDDARTKVLVLSTSPRLQGNSRMLATALCEGATEAGHQVIVVDVAEHVSGMLRYCRLCRRGDGECSIDDGYREILLDLYLPADVVVFGTPIWWYGMTAHLKNFMDRFVCYTSEDSPYSADVRKRLMEKRVALLMSAEESNFPARMAIVTQVSEFCRYMRCEFLGIVTGIGNRSGEVSKDPLGPVAEARELGRRLMAIKNTDYELDVVRSKTVWESDEGAVPSYWR